MSSSGVEATFGFVDLAGFTALTEAHGDDEAVTLLERFEALVRGSLADDDQLIKTIGDAVMVRFRNPTAATESVRRLYDACASETAFPSPRAGLHHGPALERHGDWFGATVNLAARVTAQAHGGQVLATAVVAEAAALIGVEVVVLGAFPLRNIAQPVELYELQVRPPDSGTALDPVCRMQVARVHAAGRLRHHHMDYWFCSFSCAGTFAGDPERYVVAGPADPND